jgi:thymidylate kinase
MENKFIVVEGLDNSGKDTQIKNILAKLIYKPSHVLHYSAIPGVTPDKALEYNHILYPDMFNLMKEAEDKRNLVFNRSYLGEFVYGKMYRNYDVDYVFEIEKKYVNEDYWKKLYLIIFIDDVENLIKREDGLSFSVDPIKKQEEIDRFNLIYDKTNIEKKILINISGKSIAEIKDIIYEFIK